MPSGQQKDEEIPRLFAVHRFIFKMMRNCLTLFLFPIYSSLRRYVKTKSIF